MARPFKFLLWFVGAFVALFLLATVALTLFFDPNDFREQISGAVKDRTGRDLTIEGDISLDVFPWLAVKVGEAHLGNSPGFGDEPMVSVESASFSVRLLPVIVKQEVVIGGADIDGLRLNLAINERGVSNWSDLITDAPSDDSDVEGDSASSVDVNSVDINRASVSYTNAETGETILLDDINLKVGRFTTDGTFVPIDASLNFDIRPAALSGNVNLEMSLAFDASSGVMNLQDVDVSGDVAGVAAIESTMSFTTEAVEVSTRESRVTLEPIDLTMLDIHIGAAVEPFSYEERITPSAAVTIDEFSPRDVMKLFDVEAPETADPSALSRLKVAANAQLTTTAIDLKNVVIEFDETTVEGSLSVPRLPTGTYQFDLVGDVIDLAGYMEPASDTVAADSDDAVPVDIPVDLIKSLNTRGKLTMTRATLGDIVFENVTLGLTSGGGKLRISPVSSDLFGGSYNGDVRIDVSGSAPALSVNEKIEGVDIASLAKAMFDQENVTGSIDGTFTLSGRGKDSDAIQRALSGNMALTLKDGTYEGTDIWYELRRARALLKGEAAPEPELPAKTAFSKVQMTGVVTDGVMRSDDLFAELPFMQLTGRGQVNIPAATVDYGLSARILERPEFLANATPAELDEFTEAVIPLKIKGPLTAPDVKPDVEQLLRNRVKDEIEDKLKDKLKGLFD